MPATETPIVSAKENFWNEQIASTVPHILATFKGEYYKGTPGAMETEEFEEIVKVPIEWINKPELTPPYVFNHKFAPRVLKGKRPGFSSVRKVELIKTWFPEGNAKLPTGMDFECQLNWTAEYEDMILIAKQQKGKYRPLMKLEDGTVDDVSMKRGPEVTATININLFSSVSALCQAVRDIREDPEGFEVLQFRKEKIAPYLARKDGDAKQNLRDDQQLKALGY